MKATCNQTAQRTFTVTLGPEAAASLANFCDEFRRVSPEGLIVNAAEDHLKSCDEPCMGLRSDAALWAAATTERLAEERKGPGAIAPAFVLKPDRPGRKKKVGVAQIFGDWGQFTFPASGAAEGQFLAAAAALGAEPSRLLFDALTAMVEATVPRRACWRDRTMRAPLRT